MSDAVYRECGACAELSPLDHVTCDGCGRLLVMTVHDRVLAGGQFLTDHKPDDGTDRHGTLAGYKCDGCRCAECRAANSLYVRERRRSVRAQQFPSVALALRQLASAKQQASYWKREAEEARSIALLWKTRCVELTSSGARL